MGSVRMAAKSDFLVKRTPKLLYAVCNGIPIVDGERLVLSKYSASVNNKHVLLQVRPKFFILEIKDSAAELNWNFTLNSLRPIQKPPPIDHIYYHWKMLRPLARQVPFFATALGILSTSAFKDESSIKHTKKNKNLLIIADDTTKRYICRGDILFDLMLGHSYGADLIDKHTF